MKNKSNFFKANFIYFFCVFLFAIVRIVNYAFDISFKGSDIMWSIIGQIGILFVIPLCLYFFIFKKSPKQTFNDLRFKAISPKNLLICLGLGVCIFILNSYIANFFYTILEFFGYSPTYSTTSSFTVVELIKTTILSCILPAICEEFVHRGILFSSFNSQIGMKKAMIFSALMFGLLHYNIGQFGYAFFIGMVLAYVTFTSGSIIPAIVMHFMNNFLGTYISFSAINNLPLGKAIQTFEASSEGSSIIVNLLILAITITIFRLLLKIMLKDIHKKKFLTAKEFYIKQYLRVQFIEGKEVADKLFTTNVLGIPYHEDVEIEGKIYPVDIKIPITAIGIASAMPSKASFKESIFFYANIIIGIGYTLLSFFWGIM